MTQTVFTVKIPEKLKNDMKEIEGVNWSEYVRDCLQKKVDQQKMKAASDELDRIRKTTKPTSTEEIVAWIREDRER
jgi:DNA-binding protein